MSLSLSPAHLPGVQAGSPRGGPAAPAAAISSVPSGGGGFESQLQALEGATRTAQAPTAPAALDARPPVGQVASASEVAADVLSRADASNARLDQLLSDMTDSQPYSVRDLLQLQLEAHRLFMTIEMTTKGVGEAGASVKQMANQQI